MIIVTSGNYAVNHQSEQNRKYTKRNAITDKRITVPVEVEDLSWQPDAYIETAEFDCLHDDGILYAKRLTEAGVDV